MPMIQLSQINTKSKISVFLLVIRRIYCAIYKPVFVGCIPPPPEPRPTPSSYLYSKFFIFLFFVGIGHVKDRESLSWRQNFPDLSSTEDGT